MTVAFVVQIVILLIGVPVGALAGWFGGRLDNILMRITDVIYAFPDLLFIILLSVAFRETFFGKALDGLLIVFVAIGLTSWVTVARLVRGPAAVAQGDRVRRGGPGDRRVRPEDRHEAPPAERDQPDHRGRHARHPGRDPRRGDAGLSSASASSRRGRRGAASSPRVTSTSARSRTSSCSRRSPIALALVSFTFLGDGLRDALDPKLKGKQ